MCFRNKEWFRFSYLASESEKIEEKGYFCIFGEVILDRLVLIEDSVENIESVWRYLEKEKGFIKKSSYDKLGVEPNFKKVGFRILEFNTLIEEQLNVK